MGKQELLDRARDELFSHIHRCGVLQASESDQDSWMSETIEYLAERYPDLSEPELGQLKTVGMRFCQPVISRLPKSEPEETTEAAASNGAVEAEAGSDVEQVEATAEAEEVAVGVEAGADDLTSEVAQQQLD